jgi:hypothetical protein
VFWFWNIPTAQTSFADTAVTLLSTFAEPYEVFRFGLGKTLQLVPFQCSTRVTWAPVDAGYVPTAQAFVDEIALTEERTLPAGRAGLGTVVQLVPLKCWISGWLPPPFWYPTAHTSEGPVAATPLRMFTVPLGLGLALTLHAVPFQCSIRVRNAPFAAVWKPTAQTFVGETAATPLSEFWIPSPPVMKLGLGTTFQAVPFHLSTSVFMM